MFRIRFDFYGTHKTIRRISEWISDTVAIVEATDGNVYIVSIKEMENF